jgi:hypothetical protein
MIWHDQSPNRLPEERSLDFISVELEEEEEDEEEDDEAEEDWTLASKFAFE